MQPNKPSVVSGATAKDAVAKNKLKGNLFILISTIFFGINVPVLKFLTPAWMSGQDAAAFRIFGGCVLLWLASVFIRNDKIQRRDWLRIILGGGAGLFLFLYLFCMSLEYASPVDVSIILTTPPLFVIFIGVVFQHRKLSPMGLTGVLVGLAGAALVILTQGHGGAHASDPLKGNLLAIGSSVCYAFYLVILERPSKAYNTVTLMRWVFGCAAGVAIPLLFVLPKAPIFSGNATLTPWLMIGFVVIFPTFVSYLLVSPAIKLIGSKMVSMYQYLVPVVALIASICMELDRLRWEQPVAIVVVVIGMLMTNRAQSRLDRSPLDDTHS